MQNLKLTSLLEKMIRAEIKRKPIKETYFRLTNEGEPMGTGCNSRTKEELVADYIDLVSSEMDSRDLRLFKKMSADAAISHMQSLGIDVEESPTPFPDEDEDY